MTSEVGNSPRFKNADELIEFLDSLHEMTGDGDVISNLKWEPAQIAANALRKGVSKLTIKVDASEVLALVERAAKKLEGVEAVLASVIIERMKQDAQWGGAENDDKNTTFDWLAHIGRQTSLAHYEQRHHVQSATAESVQQFRSRMVKISALALAAIEAADRLSARVGWGEEEVEELGQ